MDNFDLTKLTSEDYSNLGDAVSRAAPRVRIWYALPPVIPSKIDQERIIQETEATSDYDKFPNERMSPEYDSKKIHFSNQRTEGVGWKKILGFRKLDICVYNPKKIISKLNLGKNLAQIVQIDGNGWGNQYVARVDFESGLAFLNEEDQDIAHKLGLIYTPSNILDVDSLSCSTFELHRDKAKIDEKGETILYCDNPACQKRIRNPTLVVEEQTGGLYHSPTCFRKDLSVKAYLINEKHGETKLSYRKISLEEAIKMYQEGNLQQSENPKNTDKFRNIETWPEAAILFH